MPSKNLRFPEVSEDRCLPYEELPLEQLEKELGIPPPSPTGDRDLRHARMLVPVSGRALLTHS